MNTEIFKTAFNTSVKTLKKYSPQILVGTGIIAGVAAGVTACMATRKIDTILDPAKKDIKTIKGVYSGDIETDEEYTEKDYKKDLTITYTKTGLQLVKLYAAPIILTTVSITSILAGFNILNKRYSNVCLAYAGLAEAYNKYRKRVKEELGDEMDKHFRLGTKVEEKEETVEGKNGKEKTKKVKEVTYDGMPSIYAKFFDAGSRCWSNDPQDNLTFLRQQQAAANRRLKSQGHLYLNEVYDMLDIPRNTIGQRAGWLYDDINPTGDNYVDFGIYDALYGGKSGFVNGSNPNILLDFNCDGDILALQYAMEKQSKEYKRAVMDMK